MLYQIMLAIGILLVLISIFTLRQSLVFLKNSERAIGKVIEVESVVDNDGTTYKPIFKFKTSLYEERTYTYPFSSSPAAWAIGDEATIAYDSSNPDNTKVLTYFGTFGLTVILFAIAMPAIVISLGFYWSKHLLA